MKTTTKVQVTSILILLFCEIFLRLYNFQQLNPFGWDQVDNAWAAKHILVDHVFPLSGMVLRQNSNITIGPLYYYFVSIFYFFTHLDPIASGIIAGVTSVVSFLVLFFVTKKLFSFPVALVAVLLNTFSLPMIFFDRTQWPVAFIPCISLLIFYLLYKAITKSPRYLLALGFVMGLSFHIHFTSIFYAPLFLLSLPLLPRKKETLLYGGGGLLCLVLFLIPSIITFLQAGYFSHALSYGGAYYHGFHFRRMLQLSNNAFIQFIPYTTDFLPSFISDQVKNVLGLSRFMFLPLFSVALLIRSMKKDTKVLVFLTWIWFVVPWVVMTTYKGEISDYYFSSNKFIALFILSYLLMWAYQQKLLLAKGVVIFLLGAYMFVNIFLFFQVKKEFNLLYYRQQVIANVKISKPIPYTDGDPESYLYYLYAIMKVPYQSK